MQTDVDLHVREAAFLERRSRMLRAAALLYGGAGLAIALLALAKHVDEAAFRALLPPLVLSGLAGGLGVWLLVRRAWRCPECASAWPFAQILASARWQHCPDCGAALRVSLEAAPPAEPLDPALRARFKTRGRLAGVLVAVIAAATLFALHLASRHGLGEVWLDGVGAAGAGLALAVVAVAQRCPACRLGLIPGRSGHCWRCGAFVG